MNGTDQLRLDALSVIKQWEDNNRDKVLQYLNKHQWLKADIIKLENCVNKYHLVKVAITAICIYGITDDGMIFVANRSSLGIADNFA